MPMTNEELIAERQRAEKLGAICAVHGYPQAEMVYRHTVDAIKTEQAHRDRGGHPNG